MSNISIREMAKKNGIKHWQIAEYLGISEQTIMRWLRKPLSEDKEQRITKAINDLAKLKQKGGL